MVAVVFVDGLLRCYKANEMLLQYQSERNLYLAGFTIFLSWISEMSVRIIKITLKSEEMNKINLKQHGNSMKFVNDIIEKHKKESARNKELENEIAQMEKEIEKNTGLVGEMERTKKLYLKMKDKYEKLKEEKTGETRKSK